MLCASNSSLLFASMQSLWLADSDFQSLWIHTGGKLGTLRECTKFLMNLECLIGNVGPFQCDKWSPDGVIEAFFSQLQIGKVVQSKWLIVSALFKSTGLYLGSFYLLLLLTFYLNNKVILFFISWRAIPSSAQRSPRPFYVLFGTGVYISVCACVCICLYMHKFLLTEPKVFHTLFYLNKKYAYLHCTLHNVY